MRDSNWAKIEALYFKAMDVPDVEREQFLQDMSLPKADYESLIKLVRAARIADGFMQTAIGLDAFAPALSPGDVFGAWTVLRNIGAGGMGEVYFVERRDESFLQIAALKIARIQDEIYLDRFLRERRILAQLEHPNICRLIDGGVGHKNQPYMVMELVDGVPITEFAKTHALSETKILLLLRQVCAALSHAHGRLILHRDLKPGNVLVSDAGQVKLIDFGIAGEMSQGEEGHIPATRPYAAPEHLSGELVTTASDVYSLGCLIHELIAGQRLGVNRTVNSNLPADLKAVVEKCIQKNPAERYGTVQALAEDIGRYLDARPVLARRASAIYSLTKSMKRHKIAYAASALFLLSLIVGLAGTYSQMSVAKAALVKAQKAELEREFEARTLTGYFYGLQALYGGDQDNGDAIDPDKIDRSMIRLAEAARQRFDGRSLEDAFLLYSMGGVMASRYDFERAAYFLQPLENLPMDSPIAKSLSFESRSDLARALVETGQTEKAMTMIRTLLKQRKDEGYEYDMGHVQDASGLASLTQSSQDRKNVIRIARETIKVMEADEPDASDISWLYNQIGTAYFADQKVTPALDAFEKAYLAERALGVRSLDDITGATNLALFQIYFGRDGAKPLSYLHEYLEPALDEFGSAEVYAFIQGLRAEAALLMGDWALAEAALQKGLPKIQNNRNFRDGWYYEMIVMRVRALVQLADLEQAQQVLDKAISEFDAETDTSSWGFTSCKLTVIGGYLEAFKGQGRTGFENGIRACKSESQTDWSGQIVVPQWLAELEEELPE